MQILRVFNNNVVLARRDDEEVIVTGRGLGFQAKTGDDVDPTKVVRVFVPADGRDPDHSALMLAAIPGEYIRLVLEAMERAGLSEKLRSTLTLVIALADHVHAASTRTKSVEYPLEAEVRHLYAEDFHSAQRLLKEINSELQRPLHEAEAIALTLHIVNAGFSVGDLSGTYRMTGLIEQLLESIGGFYGTTLSGEDISVARFITHLRYLFVRMAEHKQLDSPTARVASTIAEQYPTAAQCAEALSAIIELRMNAPLTAEEVSYLTLHVARLGADNR